MRQPVANGMRKRVWLAHTELPDPAVGPRKIDVGRMYDLARFRPVYSGKLGEPLLLLGTPVAALT